MSILEHNYNLALERSPDICEHIPTLKRYASECEHITEMGVRWVCSTWAFLIAKPKKMISYDIEGFSNPIRKEKIEEVLDLTKEYGIDYSFVEADVLKTEIEPTDLLFIDTFHTYNQLSQELQLHADKVSKYIIFHDTVTFGQFDETPESTYVLSDKINLEDKSKTGLVNAINDFLSSEKGESWEFEKIFTNKIGRAHV